MSNSCTSYQVCEIQEVTTLLVKLKSGSPLSSFPKCLRFLARLSDYDPSLQSVQAISIREPGGPYKLKVSVAQTCKLPPMMIPLMVYVEIQTQNSDSSDVVLSCQLYREVEDLDFVNWRLALKELRKQVPFVGF